MSWTPNPNPRAPLALIGKLGTDRPTSARVFLDDGQSVTTLAHWPELERERELRVLGFRSAIRYSVQVEVTDASGRTARSALDERGDVVWFYEAPHAISEAKRLANGNLLYYH